MSKLTKCNRLLADLKDHPRQAIYRLPTDREIADLSADIKRRGLQHPIEILPDGTIIKGHKRRLALTRLGHTQADVIVRRDLESDADATEGELLRDNLVRRHLSPLERCRSAERLAEMASGKWGDSRTKMREYVANLLNVDGRTVNRFLRVLRLPRPLQDLFDDRKIGHREVSDYFNLTCEEQDAIERRLASGEDPELVIVSLVTQKKATRRTKSVAKVIDMFLATSDDVLQLSTDENRSDSIRPYKPRLRSRVKKLSASLATQQRRAPQPKKGRR